MDVRLGPIVVVEADRPVDRARQSRASPPDRSRAQSIRSEWDRPVVESIRVTPRRRLPRSVRPSGMFRRGVISPLELGRDRGGRRRHRRRVFAGDRDRCRVAVAMIPASPIRSGRSSPTGRRPGGRSRSRSAPSTRTISYGGIPTFASGRPASGRTLLDRVDDLGPAGLAGSSGSRPRTSPTFVRGRKTSSRQPHRGHGSPGPGRAPGAASAGPSVGRPRRTARRRSRRGRSAARSARGRSRGSGSRRGAGASSCRTGSSRR